MLEDQEELQCLDCGKTGPDVEPRWPGYGHKLFVRCEKCGDARVEREEENRQKYFGGKPTDFDYLDAGEYWYEDEY